MTLVRTVVVAWLAAAGCSGRPAEDRAQPAPTTQPAEATPSAAPPTAVSPAAVPPATASPAVVPTPGPAGGTGPAEGAGPAGRVNGAAARKLPDGFPPDCVAYAALIEKLGQCDQLGTARDGLTQAYRDLASAWPTVPVDQRAQVEAQCKTQAESLHSAAAATCGW
jgi:hypothetical protein